MFADSQKIRRQQIREKIVEYDRYSVWSLIKSDSAAYCGWKRAVGIPGFWVGIAYRIGHCLYKQHINWLSKIIQGISNVLSGCDISRKAVIGPGLTIYHPKDIFVGTDVYIGKFCQLGPHVFIGSNLHPFDHEDYPVIDDDLMIAVGAVILGRITIGSKVQIAPNAVVLNDVADNYNVLPLPSRAVPRDGWKKQN